MSMAIVRRSAGAVGVALVLAGFVGTALAPFLAWSTDPSDGAAGSLWEEAGSLWARSVPAAVALLVLGSVASAASAVARWRGHMGDGAVVWAALAAAAAGVVATVQSADVPDRMIGLGGPVGVLAAAALAVGWVAWGLARMPGVVAVRGPVPWLVAAVVLGLLTVGAVPAVDWYRQGRFVAHTTAQALPQPPEEAAVSAPGSGVAPRWRLDTPKASLAGTAGRYAVLRTEPVDDSHDARTGVQVVDAATGAEHWHYWRSDVSVRRVAVSDDGDAVVVLFRTAVGELLLLALETGTGEVRWQRWLAQESAVPGWHGIQEMLVAGSAVVLTTLCGEMARERLRQQYLDYYHCREEHGRVLAIDLDSGETGWRWAPQSRPAEPRGARESEEAPCFGVDAAPAGGTLVVQVECPTLSADSGRTWFGPAHQRLVGLSLADGQRRWQQEPSGLEDHLLGPPDELPPERLREMRPYGDHSVLVHVVGPYQTPGEDVAEVPPHWAVVDAADGTVSSTVPLDRDLMWLAGDAVTYLEDGADLVAVDPETGDERWRVPQAGGPAHVRTTTRTLGVAAGDAAYLVRWSGERAGNYLRLYEGEVDMRAVDSEDGQATQDAEHELAAAVHCPRDPCLGVAAGTLVLVTATADGDTMGGHELVGFGAAAP